MVMALMKCVEILLRLFVSSCKTDYFVSESDPSNKAAVWKFMMNDGGDDYWFPGKIQFLQLFMHDVTLYCREIISNLLLFNLMSS